MQIILKDYVRNLGDKGDLVDVKPGYANNFLIPQGLATPATKSAIKNLEEIQRQMQHRRQREVDEAQAMADKVDQLDLKIEALVGENERIFGSVTPLQLANHLEEAGIEVDRRKIHINDEIKTLGEYEAEVVLDKEVTATLKFQVVEKTEQ